MNTQVRELQVTPIPTTAEGPSTVGSGAVWAPAGEAASPSATAANAEPVKHSVRIDVVFAMIGFPVVLADPAVCGSAPSPEQSQWCRETRNNMAISYRAMRSAHDLSAFDP